MARNQRQYNAEYKVQVVKFAQEMDSCKKAADELGISPNTLHGWIYVVRDGCLGAETGAHTDNAITLNEKLIMLCKKVKEQEKEIKHIKKIEKASVFFAVSHLKSQKTLDYKTLVQYKIEQGF